MVRLLPALALLAALVAVAPVSAATYSHATATAAKTSYRMGLPGISGPMAAPLTISHSRSHARLASTSVQRRLLRLINHERAAHHLRALKLNQHQSACSAVHSRHMAAIGYLSHDQFPGDVCISYAAVAENVGMASTGPVQAIRLVNSAMMAEGPCPRPSCPGAEFEQHGHYVNLLSASYKTIGIGIVISGGTTWVTEDFTG